MKRLRDIFGDELFLRRPYGMAPTATALALEAPVMAATHALRGALGSARSFDPVTAAGIVRIAALDVQQAVVIPSLAAQLRRIAAGEVLADGRVEFALGYIWNRPDTISAEPPCQETYALPVNGIFYSSCRV